MTENERRRQAGPGARTCPSGACGRDGAAVLGMMTGSGRLAYLPVPVPVDPAFAARLMAGGRPESRFRFSQPCAENGCPQWTGEGCGVIDHLVEDGAAAEGPADGATALPLCGIRASCRWFSQRGAAACSVCPSVVADIGGSATYRSTHP
ncbi:hypothetical protein ACFYNO_17930 [Kitasatospora sp. NPDC006697]|uniref:hypothetical protein n=1 Tax=Kitasatospora sp. NPDC006697 TaxID=3364020 RepID=UPI0036849AAA